MTRGFLSTIHFFTIVLPILFTAEVLGQQDDISKYFDDGGISRHKYILKCNVTSSIAGDIPLYLEYTLNDFLKIEAGVGIIPFVGTELIHPVGRDVNPAEVPFGVGYSLHLHPKYYIEIEPGAFRGYGIQYRRRLYNTAAGAIVHSDYSFNYSQEVLLGKRFFYEYNIGIGYRVKDFSSFATSNPYFYRTPDGLVIPLGLKFGIIL